MFPFLPLCIMENSGSLFVNAVWCWCQSINLMCWWERHQSAWKERVQVLRIITFPLSLCLRTSCACFKEQILSPRPGEAEKWLSHSFHVPTWEGPVLPWCGLCWVKGHGACWGTNFTLNKWKVPWRFWSRKELFSQGAGSPQGPVRNGHSGRGSWELLCNWTCNCCSLHSSCSLQSSLLW